MHGAAGHRVGLVAAFLLVPGAITAWVVRVGVDIDDGGLTVRSMLGQRRVPWNRLAGIRVAPRGELWLVTTEGTQVRMPVLRARDLPRLADLSGGRIDVPRRPPDRSIAVDDVLQLAGQDAPAAR